MSLIYGKNPSEECRICDVSSILNSLSPFDVTFPISFFVFIEILQNYEIRNT